MAKELTFRTGTIGLLLTCIGIVGHLIQALCGPRHLDELSTPLMLLFGISVALFFTGVALSIRAIMKKDGTEFGVLGIMAGGIYFLILMFLWSL